MTRNEYFQWMVDLVGGWDYTSLLSRLYYTQFTYTNAYDENRAVDGIDLRRRAANDLGIDATTENLPSGPCSMLEMMIALALRCEETIMTDDNAGDRLEFWFWGMIKTLGLYSFDNEHLVRAKDYSKVEKIISRFLNRQYEPNGKGGLFYIENCPYDLRNVEIWYQLCWYLDYTFC